MTTIDAPTTSFADANLDHAVAERRLRTVLATDAVVSTIATAATAVFSAPVSEVLDIPRGVVLAIVAGLAVWIVGLTVLARADRVALVRHTPSVVVGNLAWAVLTPVVLVAGLVNGSSWWLLGPLALVVADLGLVQWWCWRRLR